MMNAARRSRNQTRDWPQKGTKGAENRRKSSQENKISRDSSTWKRSKLLSVAPLAALCMALVWTLGMGGAQSEFTPLSQDEMGFRVGAEVPCEACKTTGLVTACASDGKGCSGTEETCSESSWKSPCLGEQGTGIFDDPGKPASKAAAYKASCADKYNTGNCEWVTSQGIGVCQKKTQPSPTALPCGGIDGKPAAAGC
jgi:hypothetical protein